MQMTVGTEIDGKMVYIVIIYSRGDTIAFRHKMSVFEACAFLRVMNAATHNAELDVNAIVNGWKGEEEE
jgi:hypothetical protein